MRSLEDVLQALVDQASPGEVRLSIPRFAWLRDLIHYEVSIQTRSYDEVYTGKTLGEAIRCALSAREEPTIEGESDPVVPSWYRVSTMQREVVQHLLQQRHSKHMANAAAANIANNAAVARSEYALADAFKAALAVLDFNEDYGNHGILEKEVLAPRPENSKMAAKGREVERGEQRTQKEREERLSATVKALRDKNRQQARGGTSAGKIRPTVEPNQSGDRSTTTRPPPRGNPG